MKCFQSPARWTRREAAAAAVGAVLASGPAAAAPGADFHPLWPASGGAKLRGAVIAQRRRRESVDGPSFGGGKAALPAYAQSDFDRLRHAGANLIVMSFPELWTVEPPYRRDAAMADLLGEQIEIARKAELNIVLALRSGPGRSDFVFHRASAGDWFPKAMLIDHIWSDPEAQAAWAELCLDAAKLVGAAPNVVGLNLMVEPDPNVSGVDSKGKRLEVYDAAGYARRVAPISDWRRIAADCARAVRAAAPRLPILISPPGFARLEYLKAMGPPPVEGCVWCVHDYEPWAYTHQARSQPQPLSQAGKLLGRIPTPPFSAPIILGEFGAARWAPNLPDYCRSRIAECEALGLAWAAFRWPTQDIDYERKDDMFNLTWGAGGEGVGLNAAIDVLREGWVRSALRSRT